MAVIALLSNHEKYMVLTKQIDFDNDVFRVILMNTSFAFNPDTHATLADVTASQIATNFGYTQDSATLVKTAPVLEDDAADKATIYWNDFQWTAAGGDIGPFGAAVIYDHSTADKTVIGCIDFGIDYTAPAGGVFALKNLSLKL